jgi:hypothetical protein
MTDLPSVTTAADFVDEPDQVAPTRRRTPGEGGGVVPGRLAGYTWDGAAYCPECADDVTVPAPDGDGEIPMPEYPPFETDPNGFGVGVVSGFDEADYGFSCHICHRLLDTNVLVYDD